MQTTENFGLNKPEYSDSADIEKLNENFDIIDENLGRLTAALQGLATASIVIAASDTDDTLKANANYTCTGASDQTIINAAISSLTNGGKIVLLPGTYVTDGTISISLNNIWLCGCGNSTIIQSSATVGIYVYNNYIKVSDFTMESSGGFGISFYANTSSQNASFCTAENLIIKYSKGYALLTEGSYALDADYTRISNVTTIAETTESTNCAFSIISTRAAVFLGCIGIKSSGVISLSEKLRGTTVFSGCVGYDI